MVQDVLSQTLQRHVPRWVSPVIADFEMFVRDVVSVEDVGRALGEAPDSRRVKNTIHTLARLGALVKLRGNSLPAVT